MAILRDHIVRQGVVRHTGIPIVGIVIIIEIIIIGIVGIVQEITDHMEIIALNTGMIMHIVTLGNVLFMKR